MKLFIVAVLLSVAHGAFGQILINTLPDRPVFSVESQGIVTTRTVAPGNRAALEPGFFSGLGLKRVPLAASTTYYLARISGLPSLYRLGPDQVLILNQSGRALSLVLDGESPVQAVLASGNWALGAKNHEGRVRLEWNDGTGQIQTQDLTLGLVYRLILDSPEGVGVTVSLIPWG